MASTQNPHLEGNGFYWPAGPEGILLIHGFTATTAEVKPMARVLYQAGYTVSAPLLPGHGTFPEDANHYQWMDWITTVRNSYQEMKLQCRHTIVGGESLGGLLALYLASESPDIDGLLLYAPALKLKPPLLKPLVYLLSTIIATKKKPRAIPTVADELWQGYTVYPMKAFAQLLQLQKEVIGKLKTVSQPFILMQGRQDRSVHPDVPMIIERRTTSTIKEVHWLEKSGHCVLLEAERQIAEALTLSFLERVRSSSNQHDHETY